MNVPPNHYPWVPEDKRYKPVMQRDGGQLSEWSPMYNPTKEQEDADREAAFQSGVPHGYVPRGELYAGLPRMRLWVRSELHGDDEYGAGVGPDGRHRGGPFQIEVPSKMRLHEMRMIIARVGGVPPALQRLSYAGKDLEDGARTLEHYGIDYWHEQFPDWPIVITAAI